MSRLRFNALLSRQPSALCCNFSGLNRRSRECFRVSWWTHVCGDESRKANCNHLRSRRPRSTQMQQPSPPETQLAHAPKSQTCQARFGTRIVPRLVDWRRQQSNRLASKQKESRAQMPEYQPPAHLPLQYFGSRTDCQSFDPFLHLKSVWITSTITGRRQVTLHFKTHGLRRSVCIVLLYRDLLQELVPFLAIVEYYRVFIHEETANGTNLI